MSLSEVKPGKYQSQGSVCTFCVPRKPQRYNTSEAECHKLKMTIIFLSFSYESDRKQKIFERSHKGQIAKRQVSRDTAQAYCAGKKFRDKSIKMQIQNKNGIF